MSSCPYPDELLDKWDGVCNPMGPACNECDETDCEHNMNIDSLDPDLPPSPYKSNNDDDEDEYDDYDYDEDD